MKTRSVKSAVSLVLTAVIAVSQIALFSTRVNADSFEIKLKTYDQTSSQEDVGGKVGRIGYGDWSTSKQITTDLNSELTIGVEADPGYIFVEWREGSATGTAVSSASEFEVTAT